MCRRRRRRCRRVADVRRRGRPTSCAARSFDKPPSTRAGHAHRRSARRHRDDEASVAPARRPSAAGHTALRRRVEAVCNLDRITFSLFFFFFILPGDEKIISWRQYPTTKPRARVTTTRVVESAVATVSTGRRGDSDSRGMYNFGAIENQSIPAYSACPRRETAKKTI